VCRANAERPEPEPVLVLLRALPSGLPRPPRLPLPLRRFFVPGSSSASAGRASKLDVDGLVGGARSGIAGRAWCGSR
jgi:hypothetical protein